MVQTLYNTQRTDHFQLVTPGIHPGRFFKSRETTLASRNQTLFQRRAYRLKIISARAFYDNPTGRVRGLRAGAYLKY